MDLKTSDDEVENKVIEYYKRYSRNPDLVKYFTGPDAKIKPILKPVGHESQEVTTSTKLTVLIPVNNEELKESTSDHEVEDKNLSPSGVTSDKKLEWDSGADIGYKNSYNISARKSASFPCLLSSNISDKSAKCSEKSISENIKDLRNMYHQLTFSSETSSSPKDLITSSLSSTKELTVPEPPASSSTSSQKYPTASESSSSKKEQISCSSGSVEYLRKKIGDPMAISTPYQPLVTTPNEPLVSTSLNYDGYSGTPMLITQNKPKKNIILETYDKVSAKKTENSETDTKKSDNSRSQELSQKLCKLKREINLCLTKPISIECVSNNVKECVNKISQTTFNSDKTSKGIQTEIVESEKRVIYTKPPEVCSPLTQKIEFLHYKSKQDEDRSVENSVKSLKDDICSDLFPLKRALEFRNIDLLTRNSDKNERNIEILHQNSESSGKKLMSGNQKVTDTKVEVLKKNLNNVKQSCSIFEDGENLKSFRDNSNSKSTTTSEDTSNTANNKKIEMKSEVNDDRLSGKEEVVLSEMIFANHSRDLSTDIKRSIDILQKLLKSQKYDQATKKYYIKKIVQKIVESKYSGDSTSSSEFFLPRKRNIKVDRQKGDLSKGGEVKLMDNVPWYPATQLTSPRKKSNKLDCKVTKTEILKMSKYADPLKKITKDDHDLTSFRKQNQSIDLNSMQRGPYHEENKKAVNLMHSSPEIESSNSFKYKNCSNKDPMSMESKLKDYQDWKTAKTLTEKLLESKNRVGSNLGQGDYLLHVAKSERKHQLSWINNEIDHLVKLKEMLEKKDKPKLDLKDAISTLLKMKVDDMKGITKDADVFICKCCLTKGKCVCDCPPKTSSQHAKSSKKRTASLTPGYYTIETQLDPEGHLMDLTVYDEKGHKKYNYRNDGNVDDILVRSKNNNTEVKLKPRAEGRTGRMRPGPYKVCKNCGRLFLPPINNPEICLCEECIETDQESTDFEIGTKYKLCKVCGKLFYPSKDLPNVCICRECLEQEPEQEKQDANYSPYKVCEACGRLFLPPSNDPGLLLCDKCCLTSPEHYRPQQQQQQLIKTCVQCGGAFVPPPGHSDQEVCEGCVRIPRPQLRCSCQKVKFSEPLELEECRCATRAHSLAPTPKAEKPHKAPPLSARRLCSAGRRSTAMPRGLSDSEVLCAGCGRNVTQCVCCLKFVPKKPKLIGDASFRDVDGALRAKSAPKREPCERDSELVELFNTCGKTIHPNPPPRQTTVPKERSSRDARRCVKYERNVNWSSLSEDEDKDNAGFEYGQYPATQHEEKNRGRPCSHCLGVQVKLPSSSSSSSAQPRSPVTTPSHRKEEIQCDDPPEVPNPKPVCQDSGFQYDPPPETTNTNESTVPCPSLSSHSSKESPKTEPKKVHSADACKNCKCSPLPSHENSTSRVQFNKISIGITTSASQKLLETNKQQTVAKCPSTCAALFSKAIAATLPTKKSCQCCTCTNCAVQTKRMGDKNARCQCCVCENCGIQVSLDTNAAPKRPSSSKWCQPKKSSMRVGKKVPSTHYNRKTSNTGNLKFAASNIRRRGIMCDIPRDRKSHDTLWCRTLLASFCNVVTSSPHHHDSQR